MMTAIVGGAFVVGLLFGSFLNVCIARLPEHESVVRPGSHCMACGHAVRWYDNVPVVSWLVLRGKCRDCGTGISWQYPVVELAVGVWFARYIGGTIAGIVVYHYFWDFGPRPDFAWDIAQFVPQLAVAIVGFLLIGLMVMDWRTQRLPDAFTLTGTAIGFLLVCVQAIFLAPGEADVKLPPHSLRMSSPGSFVAKGNVFLTGPEHLVFGRLAAIVGAALLLLVVRWTYRAVRHRDGVGLGDVKLLAMIAAFLGWWPAVLSLFLGCVFVLPYALYLVVRKRAGAMTALPFGSFLCAGGVVAAVFGARLIAWYVGFL